MTRARERLRAIVAKGGALLHELALWGPAQLYHALRTAARAERPLIAIAEPSLRSLEGHHLEVATQLASALHELGYRTEILGHASVPALLGSDRATIAAVFRRLGYETLQGGRRPRFKLAGDALSIASDLALWGARSRTPRDRRIFFQSSDLVQLVGATLLRPAFMARGSAETQVHLFRFDPFDTQFGPRELDYPSGLYRRVFASLAPSLRSGRVRIVSDSSVVVESLRALGVPRGEVVPIPTVVRPRVAPKPRDAGVTVGFVGGARREKGALALPAIVEALLASTDARFLLQVNPNSRDEQLLGSIERLRALARSGRVRLVEEPVDSRQYGALLDEIDVLLLPYDATVYRARTSGPSIEGMAAAKVIVGPTDGWIARQGAGYAAYLAADSADPAAFAARAADAVRDFERLAALALAAAPAIHAFHSAPSLARAIVRDQASRPTK